MSIEAMKEALALLTSAHVSTDNVWARYDCCEKLKKAIAEAEKQHLCVNCLQDGKCMKRQALCFANGTAKKTMKQAEKQEPVELVIEWPEFHESGMGCGLEDRNITDRYEAMRYGWDCAIEAIAENLPEISHTHPQTGGKLFTRGEMSARYQQGYQHGFECRGRVTEDIDDGQTHGENCHLWGPKHYDCLLRKFEELQQREWVGLDTERRRKIYLAHRDAGQSGPIWESYAEALESELREKNT